jgi:hypothetical protein
MLKIYKCESGWDGYVLTRFFFVATIRQSSELSIEQTMFIVEHRKSPSGEKVTTVNPPDGPRSLGHFDKLCNEYSNMWSAIT